MFRKIKSTVFETVISLGAYRLSQLLSQNTPKILVFHRFSASSSKGKIDGGLFEKQLLELKSRFNVVPLDAVVQSIKSKVPTVKNAIVLTIDDGYSDFYSIAYPILKKYSLPATLYVTSDFVDKKIWLWPDRLSYVLSNTKKDNYIFHKNNESMEYLLKDEDYYGSLWHALAEHCLSISNQERINFITEFEQDLEVELPEYPTEEYSPLSWGQISEMANNGIEIGAHTCTHPSLTKTNDDELTYEISGCKKKLEEKLGVEVKSFSYPNGTQQDYNERVMQAIEKAGFTSSAVCFADALSYTSLFDLRRYGVGNNMRQFHNVIYGIKFLQNKALTGY